MKSVPKRRDQIVLRQVRRAVLMLTAIFLPLYIGIQLTGGSVEKLQDLPDLLSRVKTPVIWEVPEGGVRYLHFYHGEPSAGHKFVLVKVAMEVRMKLGYPVVPRCFRLVGDRNMRYYPLSRSPLFIERSNKFYLDRDDKFEGELLFEIPREREAERLLFERYSEEKKGDK